MGKTGAINKQRQKGEISNGAGVNFGNGEGFRAC